MWNCHIWVRCEMHVLEWMLPLVWKYAISKHEARYAKKVRTHISLKLETFHYKDMSRIEFSCCFGILDSLYTSKFNEICVLGFYFQYLQSYHSRMQPCQASVQANCIILIVNFYLRNKWWRLMYFLKTSPISCTWHLEYLHICNVIWHSFLGWMCLLVLCTCNLW